MNKEKPKIVVNTADKGGCNYWRNYVPLAYLNGIGKVESYITNSLLDYTWFGGKKADRKFDICGIQRPTHQSIKGILQRISPITYIDIDDNFFDLDPTNPTYHSIKAATAEIGYNPMDNHTDALKRAQVVTVTTNAMADAIIRHTGRKENIKVVPNAYQQIRSSLVIDQDQNERGLLSTRPIRIGWWGGAHHQTDWDELDPLLLDFFRRNKDRVELVMMGWCPKNMFESGEIDMFSWVHPTDFHEALYNLELDVCIAPIKQSPFANCKSNIKFIEAAMFKRCFVYYDHPIFNEIKDGETGIKVSGAEQMIDVLDGLVKDPSEIRIIGNNAYNYVERYRIENVAHKWLDMFGYLYNISQDWEFILTDKKLEHYHASMDAQIKRLDLDALFVKATTFSDPSTYRVDLRAKA